MSRFLGGEDVEENPFMKHRVGTILSVYHNDDTVPQNRDKSRTMGRACIQWADWGGKRDFVQLAFDSFSNAVVQGDPDAEGHCYGDISLPSPGDVVLVAFRDKFTAVIVGYLARNYYKQTNGEAEDQFGIMRQIIPGEMSRQSRQQAEIYQDQAGATQLIVKAQPTDSGETDGSGTDSVDDIDLSTRPSNEIARVIIGEVYTDDTFMARQTSPNSGLKLIAQVRMTSGAQINIDTDGNVDISAASGKNVNINSGSNGAARVNDQVQSSSSTDSQYWNFIQTLVTTFNTHTHTSSAPGNPTSPPLTPISSQPSSMTGEITSGSTTVQIG